ncbi:hypothetical protein BASA83_004852 [Batrachochytrium salamandrivorans]|nr:hypothetical protein BASA83_004852 [Batrachochytrium salamandrivorans]
MKLAAAIIFSLVATVTYASPAAYPENRVDMQYSAASEPVTVHLEKRTRGRLGFLERVAEIQKSINHNHHPQEHQHQENQGHQQHQKNQGHQENQGHQQDSQENQEQRLQQEEHQDPQQRQESQDYEKNLKNDENTC